MTFESSASGSKEPVSENVSEQPQPSPLSREMEDDLEPGHLNVANIERIYR